MGGWLHTLPLCVCLHFCLMCVCVLSLCRNINFGNIHLFHDEDNLVSLDKVCIICVCLAEGPLYTPSSPHFSFPVL